MSNFYHLLILQNARAATPTTVSKIIVSLSILITFAPYESYKNRDSKTNNNYYEQQIDNWPYYFHLFKSSSIVKYTGKGAIPVIGCSK